MDEANPGNAASPGNTANPAIPASTAGMVDGTLRRIGGWRALLSVWALTVVPAAFGVYILRTMVVERWPGSGLAGAVESVLGTVVVWLLLTVGFVAWGIRRT